MAEAFAEALEKSTLRTTGEVKLDPQATVKLDADGAQVKVDPTGTVRLDASGAVIRLDPNAVVNVRGVTPEVPRPTPDQLRPPNMQPRANVVTNYTVFQTVKLGKGEVVTGWKFTSNEEASPHHEYCYYAESIEDGIAAQFHLATNGRLNLRGQAPRAVDRAGAAKNCVWFEGGPRAAIDLNWCGRDAVTVGAKQQTSKRECDSILGTARHRRMQLAP